METGFLMMLILLQQIGLGEQKSCRSKAEYSELMKSIEKSKNWQHIVAVHKTHEPKCDDGIFGEAYSEKIEKLFSNQFESYFKLKVYKDSIENKFIIRHIDETWDKKVLEKVKSRVASKCKNNGEPYCKDLMLAFEKVKIE